MKAEDPPAHRNKSAEVVEVRPYRLFRIEERVSCRRDSADERVEMEVERSWRTVVVEVSMLSRALSVSWGWDWDWDGRAGVGVR